MRGWLGSPGSRCVLRGWQAQVDSAPAAPLPGVRLSSRKVPVCAEAWPGSPGRRSCVSAGLSRSHSCVLVAPRVACRLSLTVNAHLPSLYCLPARPQCCSGTFFITMELSCLLGPVWQPLAGCVWGAGS